MSPHLIHFGRLALEALPRWSFFPLEKLVVARPQSRIGATKISLQYLGGMPPPRLAEESFAMARPFLEAPDAVQVSPCETLTEGPRLICGANFTDENNFYRLWFVHEGDCLAPAVYGCKSDRRREREAIHEILDFQRIVMSIKFQPPAGVAVVPGASVQAGEWVQPHA